jgi:hypothetical protein
MVYSSHRDDARGVRAFLTERGIDLSGEQQTKTKAALEFFAAELQPDRAQGA